MAYLKIHLFVAAIFLFSLLTSDSLKVTKNKTIFPDWVLIVFFCLVWEISLSAVWLFGKRIIEDKNENLETVATSA